MLAAYACAFGLSSVLLSGCGSSPSPASTPAPPAPPSSFTVLAAFPIVNYTWDSPEAYSAAVASGAYIPENNIITGLKACNSNVAARCTGAQRLFVTVPRWLPGVPGTLNEVVMQGPAAPILAPWPSREAQDPTDCSKIQYVQSMEIDPDGIMWVVDVGRKYFNDADAADNTCPPKIVLIDVVSDEILETYEFPSDVAPYTGSFLNDIAVDFQRQVGYISDTGNNYTDSGAVVVYDRHANSSRRFEDPRSTYAENATFMIHGDANSGVPADGIALHPDGELLFYSALSGYHLYSVPTSFLRDHSKTDAEIAAAVKDYGPKPSNSDGMGFGADGSLFFGGLTTDSVYRWDPATENASEAEILATDHDQLWWVDTFAFDNAGNLLLTSNKLNGFFGHELDLTGASGGNFRIISMPVGTNSYMAQTDADALVA